MWGVCVCVCVCVRTLGGPSATCYVVFYVLKVIEICVFPRNFSMNFPIYNSIPCVQTQVHDMMSEADSGPFVTVLKNKKSFFTPFF